MGNIKSIERVAPHLEVKICISVVLFMFCWHANTRIISNTMCAMCYRVELWSGLHLIVRCVEHSVFIKMLYVIQVILVLCAVASEFLPSISLCFENLHGFELHFS